ncbi:metallophosphoesterase [Leadbetterella byssophila DSM 17132]|uniref:Metallophosphoesterase n=1 Tax=Leadbetterella byssophila (strain DSM 17132 / JCM 16389 / KACC 11308 / NBRC 106382 / 4M15) TaxID=649349 RepID=E4RTV0_LEAB4|nr:metallophosphoesterase [Leadbetterella byssophila DSM 17132]
MNKKYYLERISLEPNKKVYFASDFHLGAPDHAQSLVREKKICAWLDQIKNDAQTLFLVGDLFDFWFEHTRVVPKGYVRFLGKLAELSDLGIDIIIYQGNHDMWMGEYFKEQLNAKILRKPQEYYIGNHRFQIGHGDGLGPGDYNYKFLKVIFESKICRWMFKHLLHPDLSLFLGYSWARLSWKQHDKEAPPPKSINKEKEILYHYCMEEESREHRDFYIFGHRHRVIDIELNPNSRYVNLGDWIQFYTYAVYDGQKLELRKYPEE